jgi:hypothetical protein
MSPPRSLVNRANPHHSQANTTDYPALYAKMKEKASNPHYKFAKAPDRSEPRKHPTGKLSPSYFYGRKDGIPNSKPGRAPTASEKSALDGAMNKLRSKRSLVGRK